MWTSTNHRAEASLASRVGLSLLLATGLTFMASACTSQHGESVAARRATSRLGVDAQALRVTERTDLSTARHAVFRITERGGTRQLMVAVSSQGTVMLDSTTPDAFASLAAAEDLGAHFDQFGAARVAGWFGSFGGGRCGEPIITRLRGVRVNPRADGGHELSFQFAGADHVEQCHLVLDGRGRVESVSVKSLTHVVASAS